MIYYQENYTTHVTYTEYAYKQYGFHFKKTSFEYMKRWDLPKTTCADVRVV